MAVSPLQFYGPDGTLYEISARAKGDQVVALGVEILGQADAPPDGQWASSMRPSADMVKEQPDARR